jgi:hypothetical protein
MVASGYANFTKNNYVKVHFKIRIWARAVKPKLLLNDLDNQGRALSTKIYSTTLHHLEHRTRLVG